MVKVNLFALIDKISVYVCNGYISGAERTKNEEDTCVTYGDDVDFGCICRNYVGTYDG